MLTRLSTCETIAHRVHFYETRKLESVPLSNQEPKHPLALWHLFSLTGFEIHDKCLK